MNHVAYNRVLGFYFSCILFGVFTNFKCNCFDKRGTYVHTHTGIDQYNKYVNKYITSSRLNSNYRKRDKKKQKKKTFLLATLSSVRLEGKLVHDGMHFSVADAQRPRGGQ